MTGTGGFGDAIGISAIVRFRQPHTGFGMGHHPAGTLGMVVHQRPAGRHRYGVMVPGDPSVTWLAADGIELVQGVAAEWWGGTFLPAGGTTRTNWGTHPNGQDDHTPDRWFVDEESARAFADKTDAVAVYRIEAAGPWTPAPEQP